MAAASGSQSNSRRPVRGQGSGSGGGGGLWFMLLLIVGGAAAVYVFAPNFPRHLFGGARTPEEGSAPNLPQHSSTRLAGRDHNDSGGLGTPSSFNREHPAPSTTPAPGTTVAKPVVVSYPDEVQAQAALTKARSYYKAYHWNQAIITARSIGALHASPATKVRAQDVINGANALNTLFTQLNDRDELSRGYDTNPSLVEIKTNGSTSFAVPVRSMDDPTVVDHPVEWIASARKTGSVALLMRGKRDYIAVSLPGDSIDAVSPANLPDIIKKKQEEFQTRLDRLKNSDMAHNALAWYDAAKFAFRNRLDDRVTDMMDRALQLDPHLVESVREDKAASLFANVVLHMKKGNTKQAAAFMAIIVRRFADTESGKEARLFYDGKTAELLAERKAAADRQRQEAAQRLAMRMDHAKALGDQKALAEIAKETQKGDDTESMATPKATSGDEATADQVFDAGKDLYTQAIDAGNTDKRDVLYGQALTNFQKAQAIYDNLAEKTPNDTALQEKEFLCSKLRYAVIHQRRF